MCKAWWAERPKLNERALHPSAPRDPPGHCHHTPTVLYLLQKLNRNRNPISTSLQEQNISDCQCLGFLHHWKERASHKKNHIDLCKTWHRTETAQRRTANSPIARINWNRPQLQTAPNHDIREARNASNFLYLSSWLKARVIPEWAGEGERASKLYKWFGWEGNDLCMQFKPYSASSKRSERKATSKNQDSCARRLLRGPGCQPQGPSILGIISKTGQVHR